MTKFIVNKSKVYNFKLLDILILSTLCFICMSAGTMWGYTYRFPACRLMLVLVLIRIALNKEVAVTGWKVYYLLTMFFLAYNWMKSYSPNHTMRYFIVYLGITIFALNRIEMNFWEKFFRIIEIISIIVSVSVLLSVIAPKITINLFAFVVGKAKVASIINKAAMGQYSGLAAEIAEAAVIANYGLALSLSKIFTGKNVKNNLFFAIIHMLALILTTKRTLSLTAIVLLVLFLVITEKDVKKKVRYIAIAICLAILGVIVIMSVPSLQTLFERFSGDDYENMNGREVLWKYSKMMFAEKPLLGQGYGSYNTYANANGLKYLGGSWNANGHNSYLQLLGETGIVGTIVLLFPLAVSIIQNFIYILWGKISNVAKEKLLMCTYLEMMFAIYGITGNTLTYIQQIYMWLLAFYYSNAVIIKIKEGKI